MKIHKDEAVKRWTAHPQQSEISFEMRHLAVSHIKGDFAQFEADVLTNGDDFSTAAITLKISSKSVNTDDSKRDAELRGPEFLAADEHRQITFSSTSVSMISSSKMQLRGDLKIAGITRNVAFDMHMGQTATDPWGDETACLIITGKLTRDDWGLRWTKAMQAAGFLLGDQLVTFCKLELYSIEQHDSKKSRDMVTQSRSILAR